MSAVLASNDGRGAEGAVDTPVALITGAADGIGWAAARAFAGAGYRVVLADLRAEAAAARTLELGPDHIGVGCDVGDEAAVVGLFERVARECGRLDAVVNNAGVGSPHVPTTEQDAQEFERVLRVHLTGAFLVSREAYKLMASRGGAIVNISSIAGLIANHNSPAYNASKAGVWLLSKNIALYCAKMGLDIRSNSIHPTFIDTPILDPLRQRFGKEEAEKKLGRQVPLGHIGEPEDIANAALYLASDESKFMTGAELKLDGGISAM